MHENTVLGISIGTTTVGMALIEDGILYERQMKTFTGTWSKLKMRIILLSLERYIQDRNVKYVALKTPDSYQNIKALRQLVREILKVCNSKQANLNCYTITELKNHCRKSNKNGLMEYSIELYPELNVVLKKQKRTKHFYYIKLFEAVVAASILSQSIFDCKD